MNKPQIWIDELAVFPIDKRTSIDESLEILLQGNYILVEDLYSTGLQLIKALKKKFRNLENTDFNTSRKARESFRTLSHRILLEVENHQLMVKKAPDIPWFKKLYPEQDSFAISFPDVQALNSSWQWYKNGLSVPGLTHKIHPWYGVYFPTRFEHIELFYKWLIESDTEKTFAYDIGTGSGILSFLMENNGFKKVFATDINPNAIMSLREELNQHHYTKIEAKQGGIFAGINEKADLIVFNPPWLPVPTKNNHLDAAVYYSEELFIEFFQQAKDRLKVEGRLVLLFSNLVKLTHPDQDHPIEDELKRNERFKLDQFLQKSVSKGSQKTKRNTERRLDEKVELWILKQ